MLEKGGELLSRIKRVFTKQHPSPGRNQFSPTEQFPDKGQFIYTKLFKEFISDSPFFEEPDEKAPNGYYQGRLIIGRDTPINGGVYVETAQRVAIVVNDGPGSIILQDIYDKLIQIQKEKVAQYGGNLDCGILNTVFDLTQRYLSYNSDKAKQTASRYEVGQKVHIEVFMGHNRGGICTHQALLAGYLLEKAIKSGQLKGAVSIDRNFIPGKGGHAWVRYTNPQGVVYIIDPAKEYVGKLNDIPPGPEGIWFYKRPTDR